MNYHDTINIFLDFQRNDITLTYYTRIVQFWSTVEKKTEHRKMDIYGKCDLNLNFTAL